MTTETRKPVIGITIGDPVGIGPEIILQLLNNEDYYDKSKPIVIGPAEVLSRAKEVIKDLDLNIHPITSLEDAKFEAGTIDVYETKTYDLDSLEWGKEQKLAGEISIDAMNTSIELALDNKLDAVITAPVNKVSMKLAGLDQSDHIELYQEQTNVPSVLRMFDLLGLKVFHLTHHVPLLDAIEYATKENILKELHLINDSLSDVGVKNPKIAVAGINPHAGEGGLYGDEEVKEVIPAIEAAQNEGIDAIGPIPADTLFVRARKGEFDILLTMYHDQGHIPSKILELEKSVTVTFGLPFLQITVNHGTAFDIAGKGIATSDSMKSALDASIKYSKGLIANN